MKRFFAFTFILVFITLFASCTSTRSIPISDEKYEDMEIFTSDVPLNRDFEEIKLIQVKEGWLAGPKTMMNRLVKQAKKAGANGLVDVEYFTIDGENRLSGTAVNFK